MCLPHSEGAILRYKFKDAHNLKPQGISATSTTHIFLLAVNSLSDVENKLLQQIPKA